MTPDEREALVSAMRRAFADADGCGQAAMRAALAVAEPVVREDEREACAVVADETPMPHNIYKWPDAIAAAIRARGAA